MPALNKLRLRRGTRVVRITKRIRTTQKREDYALDVTEVHGHIPLDVDDGQVWKNGISPLEKLHRSIDIKKVNDLVRSCPPAVRRILLTDYVTPQVRRWRLNRRDH